MMLLHENFKHKIFANENNANYDNIIKYMWGWEVGNMYTHECGVCIMKEGPELLNMKWSNYMQ